MENKRAILIFFLLAGVWIRAAGGQTGAASFFNPLSRSQNGIHLYGVSLYGGYYSAGTPVGMDLAGASFTPPSFQSQNGTTVFGAGATFGWTKVTDRKTITATYSPSYFGTAENSQFNQLNHGFSFTGVKKAGRWTLSTALAGVVSNLEQLYFAPNTLSSAAGTPANFEDLAAAILAGKITDPQLTGILAGAPLLGSPEQAFYYGNRILSATLQTEASWAASERSSFEFSLSGARLQHLQHAKVSDSSGSSTPLLPQTTSASVTVGWSYAISPRTQFGVNAATSRSFSKFQEGYATTSTLSLGRTMSQRWFVQLRAGAGKMTYTRQTFPGGRNVQFQGGGTLGLKTRAHTWMASYDRSIGDIYGLGSSTTNGATGAWNWHAPGSGWSSSASFGYQRLTSSVFQNTESWHGGASLGRALGGHLFASVQYVYTKFPSNIRLEGYNFEESGVMVALTWSPSPYR